MTKSHLEKEKKIILNSWKAARILDAVEKGFAKLKCLDPFNDIHLVGILSALRMIFSFPKKVTWMLMNNTNQIQTMNMYWMTNDMPSMILLFRSSSLLANFLKLVLFYSYCQSIYLAEFLFL